VGFGVGVVGLGPWAPPPKPQSPIPNPQSPIKIDLKKLINKIIKELLI